MPWSRLGCGSSVGAPVAVCVRSVLGAGGALEI
jgi:hypothetical protein